MRTITLELLRHGPAHNQLLSPLTDYLALCDNHSAVSLQIPCEHNQMMYRLRALSYILSRESRSFQLSDTARMMGDLLGKIPGLMANLNYADSENKGHSDKVTHLRLILSSSELALLPFELALAPNGFPGAGQYLLLQPQAPICITRETRRIPEECMTWPLQPKILFVFASPPGLEAVPAPAHLLALRQAITPWLGLGDDLSVDERGKLVAQHLGVLPNATVEALENACASDNYTHIHILAHGVSLDSADDNRFGLAFHSASEPSGREVISGERLATILRTPRLAKAGSFNRPAVVTLASCNGSNVGSVAGAGASIAHALHEAGIPMVIASQFPLSFGGSVMLVQDLYDGLLWGEDPRKLLAGLRRRLHSYFRDTHDWASLTAYTSLPPDFDAQLIQASIAQANRSINAALYNSDRVLHKSIAGKKQAGEITPSQIAQNLAAAHRQIVTAKQRLQAVMDANPEQEGPILGQLATTQKREAQLLFHAIPDWAGASKQEKEPILQGLELARDYYWKADQLEPGHPWALVQYLSLALLLRFFERQPAPEHGILVQWLMAQARTQNIMARQSNSDLAWSYSCLVELYLLAPLVEGLDKLQPTANFRASAIHAAGMISSLTGRASTQTYSTRRQLMRYQDWLGVMATNFGQFTDSVNEVLAALPTDGKQESRC